MDAVIWHALVLTTVAQRYGVRSAHLLATQKLLDWIHLSYLCVLHIHAITEMFLEAHSCFLMPSEECVLPDSYARS